MYNSDTEIHIAGLNVNNGQDRHNAKQVETNSPMELVSHSIVIPLSIYTHTHTPTHPNTSGFVDR